MIWTVAKKELRGYFNSAVAVIFLAAFLVVTYYTFFWREKFFARGLADLRPLFEWMPRLLIILVSALAMRLWADERRAGTLELLLTLPIARWRLVLGKFVAGMLLIAIALALTLGLPITIARMGNLDLGPVFGGYLATLLLSAAYLVIGMCVSAATDNQIVAFVGTALVCGVAYAVGETGGSIGHFLGTGVRFESVARGVLDLRDLAYYAGIIATGIALNVLLLARRTWGTGEATRARRVGAVLGVVLVLVNAIALDAWLAPIGRARVDLTQAGAYSLSDSTKTILAGLDEKLLIRGYFSEKTHPKLEPLIPQIRDLLDEYRIAGKGKVRVELVDPTDQDDAKREAKERFAIDPTPLRFATSTEKSVINAYFAIAIEYGDQHAVLGLDDLIQVRATDIGDIDITLKNLEYQITKTVKKSASEFSSVDTLFASTAGKVKLTAYVTPKTLPESLKTAPEKLKKVVDGFVKQSGGKLEFASVEPTTEEQAKELYGKFGVRPFQDLLSGQVYYFHLLLQVGDRLVRIVPPENLGEAELKNTITDGLKRAAPGFTRVVGIAVPPAMPAQPMEGMPSQGLPPPQKFELLKRALGANYEVRDVDPKQPIPDEVETLILAGPANLGDQGAEHVDQFVMRGGALVVLDGRYRLALSQGLALEKVTTGLEAVLAKWGITVGDELVLDKQNDMFPVPVNRDLGNGMIVRELQQLPYPFFVKVRGAQLEGDSPITGGLAGSVMHFVSPVTAEAKAGDDAHVVTALLRSSGDAWLSQATAIEPDLVKYPDVGFPGPAADLDAKKKGAQVLAVAITGGFASAFAKDAKDAKDAKPAAGRLLAHSPPDARVVVFGSSAFVSDDLLNLAQQLDSDLAAANLELVHNAVDWSLADTDLLAIRSHTAAARTLVIDASSRDGWRTLNLALAFIGLGLVTAFAYIRKRGVTPIVK